MRSDQETLLLPHALENRLGAWIEKGYPFETCGLLVGRTFGSSVLVEDITEARNLVQERPRDRYELAPEDWIEADRSAHDRGHEIVGVWHAHPDHPAVPSAADLEHAWRGYTYLIASVTRDGIADLRCFRLCGTSFAEQRIQEPDPGRHAPGLSGDRLAGAFRRPVRGPGPRGSIPGT